jgi:hypothetical protein
MVCPCTSAPLRLNIHNMSCVCYASIAGSRCMQMKARADTRSQRYSIRQETVPPFPPIHLLMQTLDFLPRRAQDSRVYIVDSDSGALSCMCVWCPSRLSMLLSVQSGNGRTVCDQVNVQWSCGDVTSAGGGFAYMPVRKASKRETRETELHLRRPWRLCTCSDYMYCMCSPG